MLKRGEVCGLTDDLVTPDNAAAGDIYIYIYIYTIYLAFFVPLLCIYVWYVKFCES